MRVLPILCIAIGAGAGARGAKRARVVLIPKFTPGETLVYHIEIQNTTIGKTAAPIMNSEGATQASLKIAMRARLEVLSVAARPEGTAVRFRLTWEESHGDAVSDALDPTSTDPAAAFAKLQGQSIEFTLLPDAALGRFEGLENVLPGGVPPPESVAWISSVVAGRGFPRAGIAPGQQWRAERPISGSPLAGLFWSSQSTYDRNETCAPIGLAAAKTTLPPPECAVILSRLNIARHGSGRSAQTPPDYLHNGLRTAGTWTGSGEEIGSIAIGSGLLISATETSSQSMDYTIASASSGSSIHYSAQVQNQTGITLLEESQRPGIGE